MSNKTHQDGEEYKNPQEPMHLDGSSYGPLVGSIIIIFIVIAGGIYYFRNVKINTNAPFNNPDNFEEVDLDLNNDNLRNSNIESHEENLDEINTELEADLKLQGI